MLCAAVFVEQTRTIGNPEHGTGLDWNTDRCCKLWLRADVSESTLRRLADGLVEEASRRIRCFATGCLTAPINSARAPSWCSVSTCWQPCSIYAPGRLVFLALTRKKSWQLLPRVVRKGTFRNWSWEILKMSTVSRMLSITYWGGASIHCYPSRKRGMWASVVEMFMVYRNPFVKVKGL